MRVEEWPRAALEVDDRHLTIVVGVERIIVNNSQVVRDGAIQTMENDFDLSDPDTAKFHAAMAKAPPVAGTK